MTLRIKDWGSFQHFKDRSPPWVKLYRGLIDDKEWHDLDPRAAKTLVLLWLIASEYHGNLPPVGKLAFRLRMNEAQIAEDLSKLSHWVEGIDIDPISDRHQDETHPGGPETTADVSEHQERETEGETETETEAKRLAKLDRDRLTTERLIAAEAARKDYFEEFWKAYPKKVGKDEARKCFEKRKPSRALLDEMLAAILSAVGTDQWQREKGQFIPNPATWLNQGRWQDGGVEIATTAPSKPDRDPELVKAERDAANAAKPSAAAKAAIDALLGRKATTT